MNYYRRHIGDYTKDAGHLSMIEDGAYTRLLDLYYTREQPLSEPELYRLSRCVNAHERAVLKKVLAEFFTKDGSGLWRHKRCDEEIERTQQLRRSQADKARLSWQSRGNANASATAEQKHSNGYASQYSNTPVANNQEREKRPDSLSDSWAPDEEGKRICRERGIDWNQLIAKFRPYHIAHGSKRADWNQEWELWVNRERIEDQIPTPKLDRPPTAEEMQLARQQAIASNNAQRGQRG